jgi:hypothetical protein
MNKGKILVLLFIFISLTNIFAVNPPYCKPTMNKQFQLKQYNAVNRQKHYKPPNAEAMAINATPV